METILKQNRCIQIFEEQYENNGCLGNKTEYIILRSKEEYEN